MKKMKFNRFKNFVILVLVVAAVYQTGMLWLGSNPSHNFFYSFADINKSNSDVEDLPKAKIDPQMMVVGFGNRVFNVTYPEIEGSNMSRKTDMFIQNVMKNKTSSHTEGMDYKAFIDSKCVVYEFSFDISASEYFYDVEDFTAFENLTINSIIAVPASGTTKVNTIYLVDYKQGQVTVIESGKEMESVDLVAEIDLLSVENAEIDLLSVENSEKLNYKSTFQSGLHIFKNNVFVPQWARKLEHPGIVKSSVVDEEDKIADVENATSGFIEGYYPGESSLDEAGVVVLSDERNVVKYYPDGFMEYYKYGGSNEKVSQTLSSAYYVCKEFLKKDETLQTGLYLSEVDYRGDGLGFCFNYSVNDLPIIINGDADQEGVTNFAVEVVVENNKVNKYKRYFYNYSSGSESEMVYADIDFVGAMNQAIAQMNTSVNQIEGIMLGYQDDNNDSEIGKLVWQTTIEEKKIIINAKKDNDA